MKEYKPVIEKMNGIINDYHKMEKLDGTELNLYLKDLTSALYYLESVRSDVHNKWQTRVKEQVDFGDSVARSENKAHVLYPEMYQLRHVMSSGYKVTDAIRTNISYLKQELNTINQ